MSEISYPYAADSATGGQQMVSQGQWQYMATQFAKDRVDYPLTNAGLASADMPFNGTVVNGTSVSISPGRAVVGGFYYQLTATQSLDIAANSGTLARIDLIVIRTDLSKGSTNLFVIQGQPAASPKAPAVSRAYGGTWDMPLYQVNVPAKNGALTILNVMPFDFPDTVAVPWNSAYAAPLQRAGTFLIDMDSNNTDNQSEYFVGRDGTAVTRDFGKSRKYTPTLTDIKNDVPVGNKTGRWRYIAPGMVWFSARIRNDYEDTGPVQKTTSSIGFTLPKNANAATGQIIKGRLDNPYYNGGLPNSVALTGVVNQSSSSQSTMRLWMPSPSNPGEGLDLLRAMPPRSTITFSGVYETDTFGN
ncbi:hypothetical protein GTY75_05140 [Streptomyces sp. SID8381]|uniref:hypothetical protein n=1 Tax=unclassified Streptomyces TaxID=2593676 RepID=UPI00036EE666|nr:MULTISPECIES: hypothetical protein [unclassified Streptomyces]MYX26058.1 hypothetical protein [Streptomyces sp. SID8381]